MDDKQRIALVETRTKGNDAASQQLIRYQFGNHLGSASLELGEKAQVISYEEYTPYGSTSYQAVSSQTETPKRYRYTGKERDEESGFYYHGARYYTPWLGKWTSCDPHGLGDGVNVYTYARNNPLGLVDRQGLDAGVPDLDAGVSRNVPPSKDPRDMRVSTGGVEILEPKEPSVTGKALYSAIKGLETIGINTAVFVWNALTQNPVYQTIANVQDILLSGIGAATKWDPSNLMAGNIGQASAGGASAVENLPEVVKNVLEVPLMGLDVGKMPAKPTVGRSAIVATAKSESSLLPAIPGQAAINRVFGSRLAGARFRYRIASRLRAIGYRIRYNRPRYQAIPGEVHVAARAPQTELGPFLEEVQHALDHVYHPQLRGANPANPINRAIHASLFERIASNPWFREVLTSRDIRLLRELAAEIWARQGGSI
jgi:RHS repeat-associated protein